MTPSYCQLSAALRRCFYVEESIGDFLYLVGGATSDKKTFA